MDTAVAQQAADSAAVPDVEELSPRWVNGRMIRWILRSANTRQWIPEDDNQDYDKLTVLQVVADGEGFRPELSYLAPGLTTTSDCTKTTVDVFSSWEMAFLVGLSEVEVWDETCRIDLPLVSDLRTHLGKTGFVYQTRADLCDDDQTDS